MSKNLIGKVTSNYVSLQDKIEIGVFKSVNMNVKPFDLCALSNGHLVSVNHEPKCITVYDMDKNFELIKKIDKIGDLEISDFYLTTNNTDKIYLSDSKRHKIILVDFDFNILKEFGSQGTNCNEFDTPCGLCFYNDGLYVCDSKNKRVLVLDSTLSSSKLFCKLNYSPWQIQMSYFCACIKEYESHFLYFYNVYMQSIEFDRFVENTNGPICKMKNGQRLYISLARRVRNSFEINFYNDYGEFTNGFKVSNPYLAEYGIDQLIKIESYNQNLIISMYDSKKLLII